MHIDADPAEIGRNYQTELGVVADAKLALAALAAAARGVSPRSRGRLRDEIAAGRRAFASNWEHQWSSNQFPLRPERILGELRKAVPEDGFIVDRRRLEQERRRPAVPHQHAGNVHHAERAGDDGIRPRGGARRQDGAPRSGSGFARRRWRLQHESRQ
jgi:hypothetical protein